MEVKVAKSTRKSGRRLIPLQFILAKAALDTAVSDRLREAYDRLYWNKQLPVVSLETLIEAAGLDEPTAQVLRLAARSSVQNS